MGENSVLGGGGMGPADVAAVMRGNMGYGGYGDGWGGGSSTIVVLASIPMRRRVTRYISTIFPPTARGLQP